MWWLKRKHAATRLDLAPLGSLESDLMKRIWLRGEASVRDLHADVSAKLAYTTVMTTLDRLYKKGMLKRRKSGKAYLYAATVPEQVYRQNVAQHLIGMVLVDNLDRHAVLSRFVDAVGEADEKMLERLDELVRAKRRAVRRAEGR